MDEPVTIGQRVRAAREELSMAQAALADAIGVRPQTVYRYETGRVTPSASALRRIAQATGRPMEWFFGEAA